MARTKWCVLPGIGIDIARQKRSLYVSIVTESDELQPMRWGLIRATTRDWKTVIDKDRKNWNKNARAENIPAKWPYKKRCIIPCTGFFEWHENESGRKEPYYIHLPEEEVFSVGGLWDEWIIPDTGETIHSYVMITTEANELMREVHNGGLNPFRMPFILRKEAEDIWLDSTLPLEGVQEILQVYPPDGMEAYPVEKSFRDKQKLLDPDIIKRRA